MDPKTIKILEEKIEAAIADIIVVKMGLKKLPLLPNRRTMHLMAKGGCCSVRGGGRKQQRQLILNIAIAAWC